MDTPEDAPAVRADRFRGRARQAHTAQCRARFEAAVKEVAKLKRSAEQKVEFERRMVAKREKKGEEKDGKANKIEEGEEASGIAAEEAEKAEDDGMKEDTSQRMARGW